MKIRLSRRCTINPAWDFILPGNELAKAAQDHAQPAVFVLPSSRSEGVVALVPATLDGSLFRTIEQGRPRLAQEEGPTVFRPPETSKYFGDPQKMWMVNFRLRDLDKMLAQLRAAGIDVKVYPQSDPTGRFAHLHDPEGNPKIGE